MLTENDFCILMSRCKQIYFNVHAKMYDDGTMDSTSKEETEIKNEIKLIQTAFDFIFEDVCGFCFSTLLVTSSNMEIQTQWHLHYQPMHVCSIIKCIQRGQKKRIKCKHQ